MLFSQTMLLFLHDMAGTKTAAREACQLVIPAGRCRLYHCTSVQQVTVLIASFL